jgi:hypothetical protein
LLKRISLLLLCGLAFAQSAAAPDRKVEKNSLISEHDPAVLIELPKSVQYAGADRWVLYDIADCELHAFVEAASDKRVKTLYWVQFEGYIPSKPKLAHEYDSPRHLTLGGKDFYVDTWVRADGAPTRPGSDREHIEALVKAKGYKMPAGMAYVRLVHLLDPQKRKELMIIYGEDLGPTGHTAADFDQGGAEFAHRPELEKGLIERAQEKVKLKF